MGVPCWESGFAGLGVVGSGVAVSDHGRGVPGLVRCRVFGHRGPGVAERAGADRQGGQARLRGAVQLRRAAAPGPGGGRPPSDRLARSGGPRPPVPRGRSGSGAGGGDGAQPAVGRLRRCRDRGGPGEPGRASDHAGGQHGRGAPHPPLRRGRFQLRSRDGHHAGAGPAQLRGADRGGGRAPRPLRPGGHPVGLPAGVGAPLHLGHPPTRRAPGPCWSASSE